MNGTRAMLLWDGTNRLYHRPEYFASLRGYGIELVMPALGASPPPEDLLVPALRGIDVWFVSGEYVTRSTMERASTLKVVQRIGTGYDKVDVAAATELGILVAITPGTLSTAVAEHTFALMLALVTRLPWHDRDIKGGGWHPELRAELFEATLGIVGLGRIGREVATRALAFGMRLLAYDPVRDEAFARAHNVTYVDLPELLAASDFVSLHMPLRNETRGMIDRRALALMKPTAYLINTGRGALVDEEAVAEALIEHRLAGYGADVFIKCPPGADYPLLRIENVIATPWIAAATKGANRRTNALAAEIAGRLMTGQPVPPGCLVNPEALPAWRGRDSHGGEHHE